ncbi:MAG: PAS domain-containing protein [Chloroflexi bacterium]|nr:MAG: PAS domain-containing protein [Chloroflexota bacterium]
MHDDYGVLVHSVALPPRGDPASDDGEESSTWTADGLLAAGPIPKIDEILSDLARQLPHLISVTWCRIGLWASHAHRFTIRAAHAIRDLRWDPHIGDELVLDSVPQLRQVVEAVRPVVLPPQTVRELAEMAPAHPLLDRGVQSLGFVPLATQKHVLGLISLGEMRSWNRSPITREKFNICNAIASQTALAVEAAVNLQVVDYQRQMLEHFLDRAVADMLVLVDARQQVAWVNGAVERLVGRPRDEILGRPCSQVFGSCNQVDCPMALAMRKGHPIPPREVNSCLAQINNGRVHLVGAAAPVAGETGEVVGAVGLFWDLSADEVSPLSNEMVLSAFLHELRAPLAGLQLAARAVVKFSSGNEQMDTLLQNVSLQCDRLEALADIVLDAERQGLRDLELKPRPLDLAQTLERVIGLYKGFASTHPIRVDIRAGADSVLADEKYLRVVLCNLLDNAIKYSPAGSEINVWVDEHDEKWVVITIADEGMGIPLEQQDRIFEKFYRVAGNSPQSVNGTGLGLYIVKKLVEAHGGQVWVKSEPGRGTSLSFTLPRLMS